MADFSRLRWLEAAGSYQNDPFQITHFRAKHPKLLVSPSVRALELASQSKLLVFLLWPCVSHLEYLIASVWGEDFILLLGGAWATSVNLEQISSRYCLNLIVGCIYPPSI